MKELFSILAQTGGLVAAFLFVALRFLLREKKTMASKIIDWLFVAAGSVCLYMLVVAAIRYTATGQI